MSSLTLTHKDYKVGIICALPLELTAATIMLDERHPDLTTDAADFNSYTFGRIGQHNAVIACLPLGRTGTNPAATVATLMKYSFSALRFGLLVGIGGGVPTAEDIRLGDIVVSKPNRQGGGVIQWDFGKDEVGGAMITGSLNAPPAELLSALGKLKTKHDIEGYQFVSYLAPFENNPRLRTRYVYQGWEHDRLFNTDYHHCHENGKPYSTCDHCDPKELVKGREPRDCPTPFGPAFTASAYLKHPELRVHYGTIASGNKVIKSGPRREELRKLIDAICFEMEAAGLMNDFPCVVIRGICDYADSHKNDRWQEYAAAIAAAYAKDLLYTIPVDQVGELSPVDQVGRLPPMVGKSSFSSH